MTKPKTPKITYRTMTLKELFPAKWNPRKMGALERAALKASLVAFGFVGVIVWNKRTKSVVGGHQRYDILMEMHGPKYKVTVAVVNLSKDEERALNIQLNSRASQGEFTEDLDSLLDEIRHAPKTEVLYEDLRLEEERLRADRGKKKKIVQKLTKIVTCPHCEQTFKM